MDKTEEKRAWQAVFSDEITAAAHKNGIKVVHLSMHMPYDAVRYSDADAVICAYCGQDMPVIPTEYNGETTAYGVNYPAALITVFGGSSPSGKLPVDLPEYIEGAGYANEIIYSIGYGLSY
jgi:beta-N-acetylhexosaminidase